MSDGYTKNQKGVYITYKNVKGGRKIRLGVKRIIGWKILYIKPANDDKK